MKFALLFALIAATAAQTVVPPTISTPVWTSTTTLPTTSSTTSTVSPATNSTTTVTPPANITTSTMAPTPSPAPTPVPAPQKLEPGTWNVTTNGTQILRVHFGLRLIVPYSLTNGTKVNGTVVVPPSAISHGSNDSMTLVWAPSNMTTGSNALTFTFVEDTPVNATKPVFRLKYMKAVLVNDPARFPGASTSTGPFNLTLDEASTASFATAPVDSSYRCFSQQTLATPDNQGYFEFRDVQMQPFIPAGATGFGSATTCSLDRSLTSDVVPIAVGCALAGLVVVVIVAYIIGRRRSRQNGYTSV